MKLVVDRFIHEPPGISIVPETEFEAAILSRYWKDETLVVSIGRASSQFLSADGRCYSLKFSEPAVGGKVEAQ